MYFNLKNFIFGVGSGIIIMSLIFYCVYSYMRKETGGFTSAAVMTDEEVMQRAEALGMVLESDIPYINTDETVMARARALGMDFTGPAELPEMPPETPPETPEQTADQLPDAYVEIQIETGESAEEVSAMLYEKGVIDDETAFKAYIMENHAARKIRTGTFMAPLNGDYEHVLNIIMRKRAQQ